MKKTKQEEKDGKMGWGWGGGLGAEALMRKNMRGERKEMPASGCLFKSAIR